MQLGVHENHVIFGAGSAWLTTRRIDGQFPNVSQLRPETFDVDQAAYLDTTVPSDGRDSVAVAEAIVAAVTAWRNR